MDSLLKMNIALEYIENNLTSEIDLSELAKIVYCSTYNFQRMFSFLAEIPLSEYIRNRRLTLAALDLQQTDIHVNEAASKYGYNSPTAFTRAFLAFHGITPNEAKREGATLKDYPRISFIIQVRGGNELEYRIESKEGFDIFGFETVFSALSGEVFDGPSKFWDESLQNGNIEKLSARATTTIPFLPADSCKIYGATNYRYIDNRHFAYMLCAYADNCSSVTGYTTAHIPAQTYVIFKSRDFYWNKNEMIHSYAAEIYNRFYKEWLPTVSYDKMDGPEFEVYYDIPDSPQKGYLEMWFPIKK